jgi:hypothetical protein
MARVRSGQAPAWSVETNYAAAMIFTSTEATLAGAVAGAAGAAFATIAATATFGRRSTTRIRADERVERALEDSLAAVEGVQWSLVDEYGLSIAGLWNARHEPDAEIRGSDVSRCLRELSGSSRRLAEEVRRLRLFISRVEDVEIRRAFTDYFKLVNDAELTVTIAGYRYFVASAHTDSAPLTRAPVQPRAAQTARWFRLPRRGRHEQSIGRTEVEKDDPFERNSTEFIEGFVTSEVLRNCQIEFLRLTNAKLGFELWDDKVRTKPSLGEASLDDSRQGRPERARLGNVFMGPFRWLQD